MTGRVRADAPGKAILLGEHAVVYYQPALALPVGAVQAVATLTPGGAEFRITVPALRRDYSLVEARPGDPLAAVVRLVCERFGLAAPPAATLLIESTIPIAAGLGSGAAVCTAAAQALATHLGQPLPPAPLAALVYETEKLLHGTPSGIDNTVIAYNQAIYFVRDQPPQPLRVGRPVRVLIADTGQASPSRRTVADVRAGRDREPERYDWLFAEVGRLVAEARQALECGDGQALGPLLTRNHHLLRELDVSSPALDRLVAAAVGAGALGAKLSGGGRGGNMLALVTPETAGKVRAALESSGARRVIDTVLGT
jgi:mevalonate kinase